MFVDLSHLQSEYDSLSQGDKIRFKWYGNAELLYEGRIEVDRFGGLYFCSEHNYTGHPEILESMRFYNRLMPLEHMTFFEKIK